MNELNNDWVLWAGVGTIVISIIVTVYLAQKVFAAKEDDSLK